MEVYAKLNTNKISEKYREELNKNKLAIGEQVQYRLLSGQLNPDPEERGKKGREIIWLMSQCIVCQDRIRDPHSKDLVDIGVIKGLDDNGRPLFDKLYVSARDTNGFFYVTGGNIEQERFHDFLEATNLNESNPNRDSNVKPLFKRVDAAKEAAKTNKNDDTLTDMLILVKDASLAEKREMALAFGWDAEMDQEVITRRLREMVKADAAGFRKIVGNKNDLTTKAVINEALQKGILAHNGTENKYVIVKTGETIVSLTRSETTQPIDQLTEWLKSHPTGKTVLKNIKTLVG